MNPTAFQQTTGNICVAVAAFIYALPLQVLLHELSHKRNDHGQGTLVGIFLLVPMWLLLLAALCCTIASGTFDGLRFSRGWLYTLGIGAILSMLALSFMCFEFPNHPNFWTRFVGRVPVYVFSAATLLVVALSLNPSFSASIPLVPIIRVWYVCAGLSLLLCGGYVAHRFLLGGLIQRVGAVAYRFGQRGPSDQDILNQLGTLRPVEDFEALLRRGGPHESRSVREAAAGRLRTHPQFIETLAGQLNSRYPEYALEFVQAAMFSPAEQTQLAPSVRAGLERYIADIPPPNYMTSERRGQLLKWGHKAFPTIIEKFSATGVDFTKIMPAFEHALRPDDTRRK